MNELSYLNVRKPTPSDTANLGIFLKALQKEYEDMEREYNPGEPVNLLYFQIPGATDLTSYCTRLNKLVDWVNQVNASPWKKTYIAVDTTRDDKVLGVFSIIEDFNDDDYRFDGALALTVAPEERRKGVGRYIMNYCRGYFGEMGEKTFEVACDREDILVKTFLESFEAVSPSGVYKVGPYQMIRYTVNSDCNRHTFR